MFGLPFGVFVESSVSVLLAGTIGYCRPPQMKRP